MSIGEVGLLNAGNSQEQYKKIEPYQDDRALVSKKQTTNMS
jgi:hypothetical protein